MNNEKDDSSEEILCVCTGTTRGKIQQLFESGFDLNAISNKTGVNTGCGGCEWEIESLIEALESERKT